MIRGVHTMLYSSKAEELRAFIRDKLGFAFTDVGDGWLIFDLPEADMGCHPEEERSGGASSPSGRPTADEPQGIRPRPHPSRALDRAASVGEHRLNCLI